MIYLPEIQDGMPVAEAILIEVLSILAEEHIISQTKAASRYRAHRKRHATWIGRYTDEVS